jgi:hypothetical protein
MDMFPTGRLRPAVRGSRHFDQFVEFLDQTSLSAESPACLSPPEGRAKQGCPQLAERPIR